MAVQAAVQRVRVRLCGEHLDVLHELSDSEIEVMAVEELSRQTDFPESRRH